MKLAQARRVRTRAARMLKTAKIVATPAEIEKLEVADFGLNNLKRYGLQIIVYENNDRYCAKELVMFPRQICPEHRHPPLGDGNAGKQETFRCRWGEVYLCVPGEPTARPRGKPPASDRANFTSRHEIVLKPGDQYTLPPDTLHWFQAGDRGAIVSEFSSTNTDEGDLWTDPRIRRTPVYE